jgi:hypothetical protein
MCCIFKKTKETNKVKYGNKVSICDSFVKCPRQYFKTILIPKGHIDKIKDKIKE